MSKLQTLFETDSPVAFVTGSGAKRVGNCVARKLADSGFSIVLHALRSLEQAEETANELANSGVKVHIVQGDISKQADVDRMFESIDSTFGRIDVLINSAAIWWPKPLEEVTADDVRENLEINTLGTFLCCQSAGLRMVDQQTGGVIINLGDWAPIRPYLNYSAYFPSKGAISALSRSMAVELGSRNPKVRVNTIHPGPVMIPEDMSDDDRNKIIDATLLKKEGSPQNIADAVLALIENDFITGAELNVDGGRAIFASDQDIVAAASSYK